MISPFSVRARLRGTSLSVLKFVLFIFTVLWIAPALAQVFSPASDLTTRDTFMAMQNDTLVLIDVRTPQEWAQTGLAAGAHPISMLDREFLVKLAILQDENPGKTIAFICASGNRSGVVQAELARRGYENIYSVFGGTTGSRNALGWIRDGLPIEAWSAD